MAYQLQELSVFLPCYNEEKNLENTFNQILPVIRDIAQKWEIIIVNDGSTDKTGEIAAKIAKKYPDNIKIVPTIPTAAMAPPLKAASIMPNTNGLF